MAKKQVKKKSTNNVVRDKKVSVAKKAKVLSRSNNKMIAGVLAGVAEYFNSDPTLVRLLFVLLVLVTGIIPGILVYILAALVMPKKAY